MPTKTDEHSAAQYGSDTEAELEAFDPQAAAIYVNDLIVGLAEADFDVVTLTKGARLPYFGCYSGTPMRAHYCHIINKLKVLTETMDPVPHQEEETGFFVVVFGDGPEAIQFRYVIEIGSLDAWAKISIQR